MTKAISIHVGVNVLNPAYWVGYSVLDSCVNDARAMRLMAQHNGFCSEDADLLLDENATVRRFKERIDNACDKLDKNGTLLITFSGHGGRLPNLNQPDDPDGAFDESWCLYDGHLIDDDLVGLLGRLGHNAHVNLIADCCFAGGNDVFEAIDVRRRTSTGIRLRNDGTQSAKGSRSIGELIRGGKSEDVVLTRIKCVPTDVMRQPGTIETALRARSILSPPEGGRVEANVVMLAACQEDEVALDGKSPSDYSVFTDRLLRVWLNGFAERRDVKPENVYGEFYEELVKATPSTESAPDLFVFSGDGDPVLRVGPFRAVAGRERPSPGLRPPSPRKRGEGTRNGRVPSPRRGEGGAKRRMRGAAGS